MGLYVLLWGLGLVLVVLGFLLEDLAWLTFVGFGLGAVGFLLFLRRDQGSVAPGRTED